MNLKSNIDLTYSTGISSTLNGIVEGSINRFRTGENGNIIVLFSYKDSEGLEIKADSFLITKEEADALYTAVESTLPDVSAVGFSEWFKSLYYEGFRVEMATTFGVTVADIDIVA